MKTISELYDDPNYRPPATIRAWKAKFAARQAAREASKKVKMLERELKAAQVASAKARARSPWG